ncbi:hypothetical protein QA641_16830 [Bradyrhizobium sp. CB1650]|nr:hypothetical protein [Bradyrhizobium sp. CB1650]WGD55390.1 hypothetical protein QA641_16830 [Bradyrhizobium sp. CB1650]
MARFAGPYLMAQDTGQNGLGAPEEQAAAGVRRMLHRDLSASMAACGSAD